MGKEEGRGLHSEHLAFGWPGCAHCRPAVALGSHDRTTSAQHARHPDAANRGQPLHVSLLPAAGEGDWVAAMATGACELHSAFSYVHWTGFYRATSTLTAAGDAGNSSMLVIGPYQGGLGCLRIPYT